MKDIDNLSTGFHDMDKIFEKFYYEEDEDDEFEIGDKVHVFSICNDKYYGYGTILSIYKSTVFIKNRKKDGKSIRNRFFGLSEFYFKFKR